MNIEELCEERDSAIYEANCHILQLTDSLNAATRARDEARAEVERLRGMTPELPPRPLDGTGMPRYGLRWNGPTDPLAVPMGDGYWTPWHLASDAVANAFRRGADVATRAASNLLAVVHGDGGQYEATHGAKKACEDAEAVIVKLRELLDESSSEAFKRGAEAMREACAATIHDGGLVWTRESAERALREMILEEP
jgi:hypothetical protein